MAKKISLISYIAAAFMLLLDTYTYLDLINNFNLSSINFGVAFWSVPAVLLFYLFLLNKTQPFSRKDPEVHKRYFNFFGLFILFYIPKLIFIVFSLAEQVITIIAGLFYTQALSMRVISGVGIGISVILFVLILYGILMGRFHYKVERITLPHKDLPEDFEGLKLVHISDLHIGSWVGHKNKLKKAVKRINEEDADLIVFTGDLFNNIYQEIEGFENILKKLQAREGKLAILGNHDYGDYFHGNNGSEKEMNFKKIKESYRKVGFRLLCNDAVTFTRDHSRMAFVGVENWGLPPFHQYGDLNLAMSSLNGSDFNILLSHDPSHWKEQVLGRDDIQLTLSGHTHGMQFGIYTRNMKWSPSKWKYREWGGLYRLNDQFLYVNKGLGYLGFPGRIGIRPEITVLTLKHKKGPE